MEEEAVEITTEEVRGIDANQIASMQLKDGTVVVVQGEEGAYEDYEQEGEYQDQSNQLRARPMMGMGRPLPPPLVRPHPPLVVRPGVPPKPVVVQRGPVRPVVAPMGYRLRARPGMLPRPPHVAPRPMGKPMMPGMPRPVVAPVPVVRPGVVPKPAFPVQPVGRPVKKPLVAQMVQAPVVYRARPGQQEEEDDYQEEEYAEEEYYEGDEEAQEEGAETQFRARPVFVPVGAPHPHHHHPHHPPMTMKPKVVAVPVPAKRGPVLVPGVNTFQPRFRARPRPGVPGVPLRPMVGPGGFPPKHVRPGVVVPPPPPKKYAYGFGPVAFRSRPRSASYDDNQEYAEETEYQYTEGCEGSVCTKCGKEF